ncbi:hypothetical protein GC207_13375 [bacterium]|nr:hypothetical protein [bacterium]
MAVAILMVVAAMTIASFLAVADLIPWTTLIFIAGTVGGVVNNFRRMQKLSLAGAKDSTEMSERLVTIQIYISPFVGGVFAIILYGIFMAGLVQGSLFPSFQSVDESFKTFRGFAALSMPATNADMAKALVWAFIAGFSEGLVPNFISKITSDANREPAARDAAAETEES